MAKPENVSHYSKNEKLYKENKLISWNTAKISRQTESNYGLKAFLMI